METDDFEIEAIANSSNVKYGSATVTSGSNTISFNSSFTKTPTVIVAADNQSAGANMSQSNRITDITISGFKYTCCFDGEDKIFYSAIGN